MTTDRTILLAFAGGEISQTENVHEMGDGYECWNLRKFELCDFVEALQAKIPPVNRNVLEHYQSEDEDADYGITKKAFEECSWGLLIPDSLNDAIRTTYGEPLFLINLYSPVFLYPLFCADDFGIGRIGTRSGIFPYQDQSSRFRRPEFVKFFKTLLSQSQYSSASSDRAKRWDKEEWRLFVAAGLFTRLQKYDGGKEAFGWWRRELADIGAILESLLTEVDRRYKYVEKLKQRAAVLLSNHVPTIGKDVEELYDERSRFVHGQFHAQVAEQIAENPGDVPTPDCELLRKHRERARLAVVACLHLAQLLSFDPPKYPGMKSVLDILRKACGDSSLRKKVKRDVDEVLALLNPVGTPDRAATSP